MVALYVIGMTICFILGIFMHYVGISVMISAPMPPLGKITNISAGISSILVGIVFYATLTILCILLAKRR